MDLVLTPSSSRASAGPDAPDKSLKEAVDDFQTILTDAQRQKLRSIACVQDAQAVLTFTAQLDRENQLKKGRGIASRLFTVLQSVQAFAAVVDTFVSSNPEIAALVWGSIKLALLVRNKSLCLLHARYELTVADSGKLHVVLRVPLWSFHDLQYTLPPLR